MRKILETTRLVIDTLSAKAGAAGFCVATCLVAGALANGMIARADAAVTAQTQCAPASSAPAAAEQTSSDSSQISVYTPAESPQAASNEGQPAQTANTNQSPACISKLK